MHVLHWIAVEADNAEEAFSNIEVQSFFAFELL